MPIKKIQIRSSPIWFKQNETNTGRFRYERVGCKHDFGQKDFTFNLWLKLEDRVS